MTIAELIRYLIAAGGAVGLWTVAPTALARLRTLFVAKVADSATVQAADATGRHDVAKTQIHEDAETNRAEITSTRDMVPRLWERMGVVETKLEKCETERAADRQKHADERAADQQKHVEKVVAITAKYEGVIDEMRRASDARDEKTRAEMRPYIDHISNMEETFQAEVAAKESAVAELAAYKLRHPSDGSMPAVRTR